MGIPILLLLYCAAAAILVLFSVKCAAYVDLLDKKTNISGAFIGGIVLAAVTSLPELVTSISSVYAVHNAELIIGNVLGSNLFNLCIFGALTLVTVKGYAACKVGRSHMATLICSLVAYAAAFAAVYTGVGDIPVIHVNIVSLVILVVYVISFRFLSGEESEQSKEDSSSLTVKQVVRRFVLMSVGLIVMSVIVTYLTDALSESLRLGASLAGALFLGVATSLPELSSSITLVRLRNYNAMIGNILGSNMFNFTILSVSDIIAGKTEIFIPSPQTMYMLLFGAAASVLAACSVALKNKSGEQRGGARLAVYAVSGTLILACYAAFLLLSVG